MPSSVPPSGWITALCSLRGSVPTLFRPEGGPGGYVILVAERRSVREGEAGSGATVGRGKAERIPPPSRGSPRPCLQWWSHSRRGVPGSGRAAPSAASRHGESARFDSGLRSPLPSVEDPCPLRPSTASSGHRPCAIDFRRSFEIRPGAISAGRGSRGISLPGRRTRRRSRRGGRERSDRWKGEGGADSPSKEVTPSAPGSAVLLGRCGDSGRLRGGRPGCDGGRPEPP